MKSAHRFELIDFHAIECVFLMPTQLFIVVNLCQNKASEIRTGLQNIILLWALLQ